MSDKNLFVYHYIALYREPVFLELSKLDELNFTLAADIETNNDIKIIPDGSSLYQNGRFYRLKNKWFLGRFLWQLGLFKLIFRSDIKTVTFLGDPNFLSTWVAIFLLKLRSVDFYLWTHGFVMRGGRGQRLLKKIMFQLSSGVFLYGNRSKNELVSIGIPEDKLHVIFNSLNYSHQRVIRESLTSEVLAEYKKRLGTDGLFQMIFIGRLTFHKKLDCLIKILPTLLRGDGAFSLVFIGSGEAREYLEELAIGLGVSESVKFLGSMYSENEIAPILMASDVCIAPGEVGLTAMHAMGYGIPVITHSNHKAQMPEFEAVKEGVSGELFIEDDMESLVEAIQKVHDNGSEFYRNKCIEIIESDFNPVVQANRIEVVLNGGA